MAHGEERETEKTKKDPTKLPLKRSWNWNEQNIPLIPGTGGFVLLEHTGNEGNMKVFDVRVYVGHGYPGAFRFQPPTAAEWAIVDLPVKWHTDDEAGLAQAWNEYEAEAGTLTPPPVIVHGRP
jgi:hypothetical protein